MNELENGIVYGETYHTFYADLTEKEKIRRYFQSDRVWVVTTALRLILLYIPLFFASIWFIIGGSYGFIPVMAVCAVLAVNALTRKKTALRILEKGRVVFDETGAHYTFWLTGRYFRTEHVEYEGIGSLRIGNISVHHMPRLGRQPLLSKELCAETFGKYINVCGLGTNVLFAMQYTEERLAFFKSHCGPGLSITYDE